MVQKNIKTSFVSKMLLVLVLTMISGCYYKDRYHVEALTEVGKDTTYYIVDGRNNKIAYAGYNPISKEVVINGTHIFIENLETEECSDRIIVCDPAQQLVFVAYNHCWCFRFEGEDWRQLVKGVDKEYSIERLDLKKRKIYIQFFNKDTLSLKLKNIYNY